MVSNFFFLNVHGIFIIFARRVIRHCVIHARANISRTENIRKRIDLHRGKSLNFIHVFSIIFNLSKPLAIAHR